MRGFLDKFLTFVPRKIKIIKKFWNIMVMLVFVNFFTLPSIAVVFGFDLPTAINVVAEEESHTTSATVFEKIIPKTISIYDFLDFTHAQSRLLSIVAHDEQIHLSPYLSIFSPPPEA